MARRWRTNQKFLGAAALHTENDIVLEVGEDTLTRQEVATKLGHTHVGSIRKLDRYLRRANYKNLIDAIRHVTLDDLALQRGFGTTTLFTWMTLLDYFNRDPIAWCAWRGKGTLPTVQKRIRKPSKARAARRETQSDGSISIH